MIGVDLVIAIRRHQQAAGLVNPTAQIAKEVEGCLICPMDVLDNHERRVLSEVGEETGEQSVSGGIEH
jgi:hypothetical protein